MHRLALQCDIRPATSRFDQFPANLHSAHCDGCSPAVHAAEMKCSELPRLLVPITLMAVLASSQLPSYAWRKPSDKAPPRSATNVSRNPPQSEVTGCTVMLEYTALPDESPDRAEPVCRLKHGGTNLITLHWTSFNFWLWSRTALPLGRP